ncbi:MAG: DUF4340 domain-containing protein [Chloroflexota bacterium]
MMTRLQQILIGALAVQIALAALVFWPRSDVVASGEPLLTDFDPANVAQLSFEDGTGELVQFVREGDGWILGDSGFPAISGSIVSLLDNLVLVESDRLVTQTESSHRRLKVAEDDFQRLVKATMADGSTRTLLVGNAPDAQSAYVRIPNQAETFITSMITLRDLNLAKSGWINPIYFTLPQEEIEGVVIENGVGLFEIAQQGESWIFPGLQAGEGLNDAGVNTLLGRISSVRMTAPLGQEERVSYGLGDPAAVVSVRTPSGISTLTIGPPDENNEHVIKWSESPYYVTVSSFAVASFVEAERANFVVTPGEGGS